MKKITRILFCFLPFLLAYAVQICASIPVMGIVFADTMLKAEPGGSFWSMYMDFANVLTDSDVSGWISLLYAVICIFVFGYWYQKRFHGLDLKTLPSHFNPALLVGLVLLVPGLQYLSNYVVSITAAIHPQWLNTYEKLMETAGLTDVSLIMALYAVFVGPICEELIFRGVTMTYAEERLSFWAANLLQAGLFGLYHLNVIQGVYAFFVGLFFGYVYHKTKSIFPTMLLHMMFNAWGVFMDGKSFMYKADTPIFFVVWFMVGIILTILGIFFTKKGSLLSKTAE